MKKKTVIILTLLLTSLQGALGWDGSGTADAPYLVRNSSDWETLSDLVNNGQATDGACYRLMGDITVKKSVGTSDHPFNGTFDGGRHTITASLSTESGIAAPFAYISNATISHLKVKGLIQGGLHTAGVAGFIVSGNNNISDCHVSANIKAFVDNGMIVVGGIVGHGNNGTLTVAGCIFDGMVDANKSQDFSFAGAIVGWCESKDNITVRDCIENAEYGFISHAGMNYDRNHSATAVRTTNCYTLNHYWGEVKHGYKVVNLSDDLDISYLTGNDVLYPTTGIHTHACGLEYDGALRAGSGETIRFTATSPNGNTPLLYGSPQEVTYDSANSLYSLTMADGDTYVSLRQGFEGSGTAEKPYLIKSEADWMQMALDVRQGTTHSGKYFLLTNDIDIHTPVGGSDQDHAFQGIFDGGGHTITAHLIGETFTAPFRFIHGATIRHLHVTGSVKGDLHVAGLVGSCSASNTIEDCRVSAVIIAMSTHGGGFIGYAGSSSTVLRGCLMNGEIIVGTSNFQYDGIFIGWSESDSNLLLEDCLALGYYSGNHVDLAWVSRNNGTAAACPVKNTYHDGSNGNLAIGKRFYSISTANPMLKFDFSHSLATYPTTSIKSNSTGLLYDGLCVAGAGEEVEFQFQAIDGITFNNVRTDKGTLTRTDDGYKLKLSSSDAVISADVASSGKFVGSGTEADPFLVRNTNEWYVLSASVQFGWAHAGKVFRMTQDIDCDGVTVGSEKHPFLGIFDGDGHTLTFNAGTMTKPVATGAAPFLWAGGATFRHIRTTGTTYTSAKFGAGLVSHVGGTDCTRMLDCSSDMLIMSAVNGDGTHGGLVGVVASGVDSLVMEKCSFSGGFFYINSPTTNCGGFVGYSYVPVTMRHCLYDPQTKIRFVSSGATFARMKRNEDLVLEECYTTLQMSTKQGMFVTDEVSLPEGFKYQFVGEPDVTLNGKGYYKNGCHISITAPSVPFNHWESADGTFISDPWSAGGVHQLKDMAYRPLFYISLNAIPEAETERTICGVTYRYLSRRDYHYFISDEDRTAKGWYFEDDDSDANLLVKDSDGNTSEVTAVTGCDESDSDFNVTEDGVTGVQVINDLVGDWRKHTHLGLIAPHAFRNSTKLEKLYFKDSDANLYNALMPFDFFIAERAFENCANFQEMMMMQYTTQGNNHWEGLTTEQTFRVADDAFEGCPKLRISTQATQYQNFLSSPVWEKHLDRFIIYQATGSDFTVNGVKYRWYRDVATEDNDGVKNDESGKTDMMTRIRPWNAMYRDFSAATLLETKDNCNVYYTAVVGVDNDDIDDMGGTMRIYNDPGSYYNYKTITLDRNAISGNEHVKHIEFWQTNGRSENSYSDLKFVIPNGAFQDCKNLKELRMFYYVQDGDDHWETLGPKDVIPGNNIFGRSFVENSDGMTMEELRAAMLGPTGFKILVSPDLYPEFLDDPNWQLYAGYIEPVDFEPTGKKKDFTEGGLTYSFMTSPGGILQTSQVVSQDVSWWTVPRIAIEVAMILASFGSLNVAEETVEVGTNMFQTTYNEALLNFNNCLKVQTLFESEIDNSVQAIQQLTGNVLTALNQQAAILQGDMVVQLPEDVFVTIVAQGFVNANGVWQTEAVRELANTFLGDQVVEGLTVDNYLHILFSLKSVNDLILPKLTQIKNVAYSFFMGEQAKLIARTAAAKAATDKYLSFQFLGKVLGAAAVTTSVSGKIAAECWGGSGTYNGDLLQKGMRENILSNIQQVGLVGGGYVITTPQKNLVYHTYVKEVGDDVTDAVVYAGFDNDNNVNTSNRTMTFGRHAFRNKTNLKTVKFHEIHNQASDTGMPMLITIPDSAFVGCTALTEFSTILQTDDEDHTRALGPENFILGGDSVFVGLDSLTFHIVIDPMRKQDFLDNASWAPLERYFTYTSAKPKTEYCEYGAQYAYAYEMNSIKKENKVNGHLIEHTIVTGPDDDFIKGHQGAVKLCNDIGRYNNYQLDQVMPGAFKGNQLLRSVSFTDLYGLGFTGDTYTPLQVHIGDSAFVDCTNLADLDLLYMVTDGLNHLDPITPQMLTIGKGVFDGTAARLKMMPQQVAWFEADSSWVAYKDRFMPCVIKLSDPGVKAALKEMAYYDPANTGADQSTWDDYCDYARIAGAGFSWLDGRFTGQKDKIYSFADFKYFESVGLTYVGESWFEGCSKLGNIVLPSTIATIGEKAFNGCSALQEMELPEAVIGIGANAFASCTSLNTIMVRSNTPATLGANAFHKHDGLKIYVPTAKVSNYKKAWSDYAPYIVGDDTYRINKVVTVTDVGQLADKLGLTLLKESDKVRYIQGPYAKYDSLTVIGPLNGEDLAVIRHMAGADAYDSDPTDGCLRYLNLWDAQIKKDKKNSYNGNFSDEYIDNDNEVPDYLFENCTAIETVVFPQAATFIGENVFEDAKGLKQVCVGRKTTEYDTDLLQNLNGIEELVLLTEGVAKNDSFWPDPWEAPIQVVWTLPSKVGDYLGDPKLTRQAQSILHPLSSDEVMWALADAGHFFPTEYLELESVENIFNGNTAITNFDDFSFFQNVKSLESTFSDMDKLESIKLPYSIESIDAGAFSGCTSLETIFVGCDSVPQLAQNAFESLPEDFRILVPNNLCKLYREKWAQYADHINPYNGNSAGEDIITIVVTEPNKVAEALGLEMTVEDASLVWSASISGKRVSNLRGDYNKVRRLKIIGPISGGDLDVLRYMAGYCPWSHARNFSGHLEYIDLYDAQIRKTIVRLRAQTSAFDGNKDDYLELDDDVMPHHAFLKAYNLKTLILPKTCKKVEARALQECEGLETLVIGDDCEDFNWNALDDDAMLTRLYILTKKKLNISTQNALWRRLCNNYNPTFDAFYVLPSTYEDYLYDDAYTGSSWQRTNNISKGEFDDDASFRYFASHAAATKDDLTRVYNIKGWSKGHEDVKDLSYLGFSAIDSLRAGDMQPLTLLEKVALPVTLRVIEDSVFAKAPGLRYVDMLMCDSTMLVDDIKTRSFARLGIDSLQTLVYLPQEYGPAKGVNIIVANGTSLSAETFRLVDKDYCVPYSFTAGSVVNERRLEPRKGQEESKYTVCLPYDLPVPPGAKVYKLMGRSGGTLTFLQEPSKMETLTPYLVVVSGQTADLGVGRKREIPNTQSAISQTANNQINVPGYSMRGTMQTIDYKKAAELYAYILQASDNKWHLVKKAEGYENANIPAMRTYLLQNGGVGANSLSMELLDDIEDPDGIDTIRTIDTDGTERYYDLDGRELPGKPERGIYIRNGKKYISK
ncbi:MAG: leucine-rich repeat protein [Prevotella sp.]|nr:leucine-rich repeat protein [Prevotella sp.]